MIFIRLAALAGLALAAPAAHAQAAAAPEPANWTDAAVIVAAIGAAITSLISFRQTMLGKRSHEAQIYLNMQINYARPEMNTAILNLHQFWEARRNTFPTVADAYKACTVSDPQLAKELRDESRVISMYFHSAARLWEAGLISKTTARLIIAQPGLNIFYDVAFPINVTTNPNTNSKECVPILKKLMDRKGRGTFHADEPAKTGDQPQS